MENSSNAKPRENGARSRKRQTSTMRSMASSVYKNIASVSRFFGFRDLCESVREAYIRYRSTARKINPAVMHETVGKETAPYELATLPARFGWRWPQHQGYSRPRPRPREPVCTRRRLHGGLSEVRALCLQRISFSSPLPFPENTRSQSDNSERAFCPRQIRVRGTPRSSREFLQLPFLSFMWGRRRYVWAWFDDEPSEGNDKSAPRQKRGVSVANWKVDSAYLSAKNGIARLSVTRIYGDSTTTLGTTRYDIEHL